LFFKWTKQHLRIKAFSFGIDRKRGQDANMDCGIATYVLIAIASKAFELDYSFVMKYCECWTLE
jgi:hypothetical protein